MVYSLLVINWMIGGTVKNKLWAWDVIGKNSKITKLILLAILWVVGIEMNNRTFDECVRDLDRIRNSWLHVFGALILGMMYIGEMILEKFLIF